VHYVTSSTDLVIYERSDRKVSNHRTTHLNKVSHNQQIQKMTNHQNDVALSELIGFILLLGLVLIALTLYTVYVVPVNGREDEIAQMSYVKEQFTDYKLMVDALWTSRLINVNGVNPMYPVLNVTPMISSTTLKLGTGGKTQLGGTSLMLVTPISSTGTLSVNTTGDTFNIETNSYNSSVNNGEFPIKISALVYNSNNYYWIQQQYSYQLGGVILSQDNGAINCISPLISITNAAGNSTVVTIVPVQVFGNGSVSSNGPVRVDTRQRIVSDYIISSTLYRNNQWVNISITTANNATAAAWQNIFRNIVANEQISSVYTIKSAWDPLSKRTTVYIQINGTPPNPLVSLYVQRAEFDVALSSVATEST
jgi:hypothetical protein